MASVRWKGGASPVAQVNTITPASVATTNTFTLTIGTKSISYTTTAGTVADVCAGLAAAVAATSIAEFLELTAANNTTNLTLTQNTPGKNFIQTSSATGGTATLTTATTVANSGPNDISVASNWSTGSLPANGDDVTLESSAVSLQYGLTALSGVTLNSLTIAATFTGDVGLAEANAGGYLEYRPQFFAVSATTVRVGDRSGQGSGRIKLDTGSVQTALNVISTGTSPETNLEALFWRGTNASNTAYVEGGSVAIAGYADDTASLTSLTAIGGTIRTGVGLTVATVNNDGASILMAAGMTTGLQMQAGSTTVLNGNIPALTVNGGALDYRGAGTLGSSGTPVLGPGASANFANDPRSRTLTGQLQMYAGSVWNDPQATCAMTGGFKTILCRLPDVSMNNGLNRAYAVT